MRFHDDPTATRLRVPVLACAPAGDRWEVILPDTVLYPEGGGQPDDHGTVDGHPVRGLRKAADGVIHVLDAPVSGDVEVTLDWERRFDHMQQHSGQHLLSAVAEDRFGLPTTAFHLGRERSDIEVDGDLDPARRDALEAAVNAVIREDRPVSVREVAPEALAELPVRTRGLPAGFVGRVRLVEIAGADLNTCGGTHVARTGELQALKIIAVERLKRGTRIHFVVGGRLLALAGDLLVREAALVKALSCPPAEHLAAVERALEADKRAGKAMKSLQGELAAALGASLAPEAGIVRYHRPDGDPPFLNALADAVRSRHPDAVCLLFVGEREGAFLVAGPEADVATWGPRVAAVVEGRGGGARGKFQGKGTRIDRWRDL